MWFITETRPLTDDQPSHSREMGPELRDPSLVAAGKCNAALNEHYTTTGSFVNINPWVDDDQMHIDIYTKLQLEKGEGVAVMTHKKKEILSSIEYGKIFLIK